MLDARETLLQEIKGRLIIYASLIHAEQGRLSDGAEDFYRGLLNIMLGCELKNMNHERENYPAIDLGDDDKRICVQVTSTGTRAKVRHTLKEFFENELHERFDRLIVLVIGDAQKFDTEPKNEFGFDFQTRRDIWDTIGLFREIGKIEDDAVLERIAAYLQKRVNLPKREPLLDLLMGSAMPDDRFVGREAELRRIEEELTCNRVAFLSGLGGMGKTELALRYGEGYRVPGWRFVYFVRFKKTFDQTVTDNIAPYIPNFSREGLNERQIIAGAMQHLRRGDPNDLLILDNADDAEESVEQLRRVLRSLPMRVLVTTRAENDTAIGIGKLNNENLYDIFRNHKVTISEREMDELIAAVDGHTLTVDLMARSMTKGIRRTSAGKLLDALKKRDLASGSFTRVSSAYPGAQSQARINEHLKAVFKVADLSEEEQHILRYATLLPKNGMDPELFLKPFESPDDVADILDTLVDRGWLMMKEDRLAIHPVICIVCREVLEPTEETCGAFMRGVSRWYDSKRYDADKFCQLAELFTTASDILGDSDGWYMHQAGYLWVQLAESRQALECNLRAMEFREKNQPDSNALATSYNNVGGTYRVLGERTTALEYLLKALAIREKVLPPEHPELAAAYNNVGTIYGELGDHANALNYQRKCLAVWEKVLPPDHPDLALSYNNIGYIYSEQGDHTKALEYLLKALAIRKKVLPPDHPDLAESFNNISGPYSALGDHEKALEYLLKASAIQEKTLPENHPNNAGCYNNIAWSYYQLGKYDAALGYMKQAVAIAVNSLPEEHPDRVDYCRWVVQLETIVRERRE